MYEWIKALHVIAVISWMAGMLYLPRLFVYHCDVEAGSKQSGHDRNLAGRALSGLGGSLVFGTVAARQAVAGGTAVGCPRLFFSVRQGFRRRPQYPSSVILPYYQ